MSLQNCLEILCRHGGLEPERRDKCGQAAHDVATDDCRHLLENLSEGLHSPLFIPHPQSRASGALGKILENSVSHSLLGFL